MDLTKAKNLLVARDPEFWAELNARTEEACQFEHFIFLSSLRRKAKSHGLQAAASNGETLRLAILGGYSLYPLHEVLVHILETNGLTTELFLGDFNNYVAEIVEDDSQFNRFRPDVVFLLPGPQQCAYGGMLTDPREQVEAAADSMTTHLIELCRTAHDRTGAEVILSNFALPARHDLGSFRARTMASDWSFRKRMNLALGLQLPSFVQLCDFEFLACREGTLASEDARGWFESKQPGSPGIILRICQETARLILGRRRPMKKVLVLDLDNTLWGGVIGDDGLDGIEIGDTSPRGEGFKRFQNYIRSLKDRGVLLAICSKNEPAIAREVFDKHPEMVLRLHDFAAFKANWEPKSDNLRQIATELVLGLDSFVFVDDNRAEIEIVRQFAPDVATVHLGPDPSEYTGQLQDSRFFEPRTITQEDSERAAQYQTEVERKRLLGSVANMDVYLESLTMEAIVSEFTAVDVPRLAQLINKSNQFNLTTRRRTEAEVEALLEQRDTICFSIRLRDRFGDHGLISIVIGHAKNLDLEIDTWVMSCRVLKRQVEDLALNELSRLAKTRGCARLVGIYLPTKKNEMVRDFYPRMGFQPAIVDERRGEFALDLNSFDARGTFIKICRHAYAAT